MHICAELGLFELVDDDRDADDAGADDALGAVGDDEPSTSAFPVESGSAPVEHGDSGPGEAVWRSSA